MLTACPINNLNYSENEKNIIDILGDTSPKTILKDSILSSDFDDKCPFISRNMLVFTSNRPGGFGGFDLYYVGVKKLEEEYEVNGKWY